MVVVVLAVARWMWRRLHTQWDLLCFATREDLERYPKWNAYLRSVYGTVPEEAFPLDLRTFDLFYKSRLDACGIPHPDPPAIACSTCYGETLTNMSLTHDSDDWLWVMQPVRPVPSHRRTEVAHSNDFVGCQINDRGYWMYRSKGSGNVYDVGKTRTFATHRDAERVSGFHKDDARSYEFFRAHGLQSIQFTAHDDMKCGNTALEIVDLHGTECSTCLPRVAAGWNCTMPCVCDDKARFLNCAVLTEKK